MNIKKKNYIFSCRVKCILIYIDTLLTDLPVIHVQHILSLDEVTILIQHTQFFNLLTILVDETNYNILLLGSHVNQLLIVHQFSLFIFILSLVEGSFISIHIVRDDFNLVLTIEIFSFDCFDIWFHTLRTSNLFFSYWFLILTLILEYKSGWLLTRLIRFRLQYK